MDKTLKDKVERVLRNEPDTRNSDISLTIAIWEVYFPSKIKTGKTGERGIWLKDLYTLPREDSIKRIRAAFNREGKYYPTDWKVAQARGIKEDDWRTSLGYPTKAETVNPTKPESYMDPERGYSKPYPD